MTGSCQQRWAGVDVARAVALLGMVTVHFGPGRTVGDGAAAFVYHSFYGKASVLFALVAGVGVGLLHRRSPVDEVRAGLAYRAAWLVPLGLYLQDLDHPIAVILEYYGLYFLALVPFVGRRSRTLLLSALVWLPVGSAAVLWGLVERPEWMARLGGTTPGDPFGDLVLGGWYPLVTWVPVLLVGMWLADTDLAAPRTHLAMVAGGSVTLALSRWVGVAAASHLDADVSRGAWGWGWAVSGHSEMPLAVLGAIGFAVAVLGTSLALARWAAPVAHPLAALGRLALTVYVGHLLVYVWVPDLFPAETVPQGITHVAWFGVVTAAGATLWLWWLPRGPLEAAVRWPWEHRLRPLVRRWADTDLRP